MTDGPGVPLGREGFADEMAAAGVDVSRETLDRLAVHLDLLARWQPKINLVGPRTLADPWRRHVLDSAQLFPLLPEGIDRLVDLGSGAGFPGLVLAILGVPRVALVESDSRKAAFLREAARLTGVAVDVRVARIESIRDLSAEAVTARALAPLEKLVDWAQGFCGSETVCLFPKGREADRELTDSVSDRIVCLNRFPSRSDPDGVILRFRLRAHDDASA